MLPGWAVKQFKPGREIGDTVCAVFALAYDPEATPIFRRQALILTRNERTRLGQLRALYDFVQNRVRSIRDPHWREHITGPVELLAYALQGSPLAAEDCEGKACLLIALASSIGFPPAAMLTEDPSDPAPFEEAPKLAHIHPEFWVEIETHDGRMVEGYVPADAHLPESRIPFGCRARGRRSAIFPWQLGEGVLFAGRGRNFDGLGIVTTAIRAGSGIAQAAIQSRGAKHVARAQERAMVEFARAQGLVEAKRLEIEGAGHQLEAERTARMEAEAAAEARAAKRSMRDRIYFGAALAALTAIGAYAQRRR